MSRRSAISSNLEAKNQFGVLWQKFWLVAKSDWLFLWQSFQSPLLPNKNYDDLLKSLVTLVIFQIALKVKYLSFFPNIPRLLFAYNGLQLEKMYLNLSVPLSVELHKYSYLRFCLNIKWIPYIYGFHFFLFFQYAFKKVSIIFLLWHLVFDSSLKSSKWVLESLLNRTGKSCLSTGILYLRFDR